MKTAFKIWGLYLENFTEIDYTWITGLGCELSIIRPEPENITLPSGTRQYYKAAPEILITTTCDKQQSMLQLKYGDSLYLKEHRVEYEDWGVHHRSILNLANRQG
jgi:hypothetical protein